MAAHSSILAWEIPWTEEPGGPQSTGSQRAGHNLATNNSHQRARTCLKGAVHPGVRPDLLVPALWEVPCAFLDLDQGQFNRLSVPGLPERESSHPGGEGDKP